MGLPSLKEIQKSKRRRLNVVPPSGLHFACVLEDKTDHDSDDVSGAAANNAHWQG